MIIKGGSSTMTTLTGNQNFNSVEGNHHINFPDPRARNKFTSIGKLPVHGVRVIQLRREYFNVRGNDPMYAARISWFETPPYDVDRRKFTRKVRSL